jgi:PAS domain S-box-containing protein
VALYVSTPEGRLLEANRATAELLGYDDPAELLGVSIDSIYVDAEDRQRWLGEVLSGRTVEGYEVELRRKDGSSVWVRKTAQAVEDRDTGTLVVYGALEDMSEERAWRAQARESGVRFSGLFESTRDAVFLMQDGRFLELNPAAVEMFGATSAELREHYPYDLSPLTQPCGRSSRDLAWEQIRRAEGGEPQFFDWQHKRRDGSVFDAEVSLNPVDIGGERYLQAIVRDVTERKRLEASRRRRSDILDAVVYAAGRFLKESDWHDMVADVLERLGRAADVSRAYLYRVDDPNHEPTGVLLAEWLAPGVSPTASQKGVVSPGGSELLTWLERLIQGCTVVGRTREFGAEVRDFLSRTHVRSLALVPVMVEATIWGVIGFDHCSEEAVWSEGEVEALRAAAEVLGAAIRFSDINRRLEISETEYRDLFENVEDVICVLDMEGTFITINAAATRVLGYAREEIVGRHLSELIPATYHDQIAEYSRQILENGRADGLATVRTPSGEKRVLEFRNNVRTEGVARPLVRAIGRDITERWRAERDRQRYAAQLELLRVVDRAVLDGEDPRRISQRTVQQLRDVIHCDRASVYFFDRDRSRAEIAAMDEDRSSHLGGSQGEMLPLESAFDRQWLHSSSLHRIVDVLAYTDPPPAVRELARCGVRSAIVVKLEASQRLFGTLNVVSRQRNGFGDSTVNVVRQLGEELSVALLHAELRSRITAERERLHALLQHLPEGVVLLDDQQRILLANRAGSQALETLQREGSGGRIEALGGHDVAEVVRQDDGGHVELAATDGSGRVYEVRSAGVGGEAGGEWALVVRDVTAEREVERKLQLQDRLAAVGQLAAGIAHDFNNILQAVQLNAELMVVDHELPEPDTNLEAVREQVRRGSTLVRQILDFARKTVTRPEPLALAPFLDDAFQLLATAIPESIDVNVELHDRDLTVTADIAQMQQLVTNMVVNSADAMPDGGRLNVSVREIEVDRSQRPPFPEMAHGRWIELTVADTGMGIPEDVVGRVFEPFVTTKEPGRGTGLGLAQVYGIVKQHGGFVDVNSTVGEGTRFRVLLPAAERSQVEEHQVVGEEQVPLGSGELVLVVEDDPALLHLIEKGLVAFGYRVQTAADGATALELFRLACDEVALVVSDVVMPRMGGAELFDQLSAVESPPRFLFITGHPLRDNLGTLADIPCLTKPFTVRQLAETVSRVLHNV